MSTSTKRYMSCAETAKLLRGALKAEFPAVKFSVRSHTYAGGASIDARWIDGPRAAAVQAVCDRYSGASFDGMTDMKSYHDSVISTADGAEVVSFGADFIFAERKISDAFASELAQEIADFAKRLDDMPAPFDPTAHSLLVPISVWKDSDNDYRTELAHDRHRGEYASNLVHQLAFGRSR